MDNKSQLILYKKSLTKWEDILKGINKDSRIKRTFIIHCNKPCAFCDMYSVIIGKCSKCTINHDICNDHGNGGLFTKGHNITRRRPFKKWINDMIKALKREIISLECKGLVRKSFPKSG